uniref:E2F/DP family winged-helix DNA-binding domain-containing protein n=1 Tax=Otolemur garnettii TaxID=30611 RepID=H0Y0Y6_OTOGA
MSQQLPASKMPSLPVDQAEETVQCRDLMNRESLPPSKTGTNLQDNIQSVSTEKAVTAKRARFDASLALMTKKFMDFIKVSPGGIVDLNKAAAELQIRKRRLYDITNVLDGINLVKKISKNHVRWIGADFNDTAGEAQQKKLQAELSDLAAMENTLDELINSCAHSLCDFMEDKDNERLTYVTPADIHTIEGLYDQTVFAVKAPPDTTLSILEPKEDSITAYLKSTNGPIDVYVCEMEQDYPGQEMSEGVTSTPENRHPECPEEEENPQKSEEVIQVSS